MRNSSAKPPPEEIVEEPKKLLRSRRAARQVALQALYQLDTPGNNPLETLKDFDERNDYAEVARAYIKEVVEGVARKRIDLDNLIIPFLAKGWDFSRIAKVDRAILRLAVYELYFMPNQPPKVTINEAVNLARTFSNAESSRFVNGLLGRVLQISPKRNWDPSQFVPFDEPSDDDAIVGGELAAVEEVIEEGSDAHADMLKAGNWTLRKPTDS